MLETIVEYMAPGVGRVDRQRGLIAAVRVLGLRSKNNREYTLAACRKARPLYERIGVNIDHDGTRPAGRSYKDRIGFLEKVQVDAGGLRADLRVNPSHSLASQLFWDAEHAPQNVGLSHAIQGRTRRGAGGVVIVEEIVRVMSVDLVGSPATANSLFEQSQSEDTKRELVRKVLTNLRMGRLSVDAALGLSCVAAATTEKDLVEALTEIRELMVREKLIPPPGHRLMQGECVQGDGPVERDSARDVLGLPSRNGRRGRDFVNRICY